jgi:uncharacterized protein (DUF58 family)
MKIWRAMQWLLGPPDPYITARIVRRPLAWEVSLPIIVTVLFYATVTSQFALAAVTLGSLGVSCLVYAVATSRRITAEIQAPGSANEGDEIDVELLINARSRLPAFVIACEIDVIGLGAGRERHQILMFHHQAALQLGERDAERREGFVLQRGINRVRRRMELRQRGPVVVSHVRVVFADPLGIFPVRRRFRLNHEMLVRLKPSSGGNRVQITGASGRLETHMKVGDTGDATEFAGTRPYRPGDELRHIHWPTVARTGDLHVREYTQSSAESVVILILRNSASMDSPEWRLPPDGEAILRTAMALAIELFHRAILR